jgi:hypothetical protein
MNTDQRVQILQQLADAIARRRLTGPARLALDVIAPIAFLASQAALFARPLTPFGRWHDYVDALGDEQGWTMLQQLVEHRDS